MALVIRDVDRPPAPRRFLRDPHVLVDPFYLAQDRIERVLEGSIDRIALRRPQLIEVGVDPFASFELGLPVTTPQVAPYVLTRQHRLGDVVEHAARDYIKDSGLYTEMIGSGPANTPCVFRPEVAATRGCVRTSHRFTRSANGCAPLAGLCRRD